MSSPSALGDLGFIITDCVPLSTSTARFIALRNTTATDTGTVATTSRALDLSRLRHVGATGGKPLDTTVHARAGGPPRFHSIAVAIPLELQFHSSGGNVFVTTAIKTRAATSGAGSTWATLKTQVDRFKMGTDTDAVFHKGVICSVNAQAVQKLVKANITFAFRKASDTSAKDTTTDIQLVSNSPVFLFLAHRQPQVTVPYRVS